MPINRDRLDAHLADLQRLHCPLCGSAKLKPNGLTLLLPIEPSEQCPAPGSLPVALVHCEDCGLAMLLTTYDRDLWRRREED